MSLNIVEASPVIAALESPYVADFELAESAGTSSTTLSVPVPASTADGDDLVLLVLCDDGRNTTVTGFTEVRNNTATYPAMYVGRRVASSEPASYTVSTSSGTGILAIMLTIKGGSYAGTGLIVSTINDTSDAIANSLTIPSDDSLVLFFCGSRSGATQTAPTGFDNEAAQMAAGSSRPNGRVDSKVFPAGATGSMTAVNTGTSRKDACAMMFSPA